VLGTVVTVVAALTPAIRASRIPPMAALRDDSTVPVRSLRLRAVIGGIVVAAGAAAMVAGALRADGQGSQLVGLGAVATLVGVVILSPVLARPLVRVLGAGLPRLFGTTGRLAIDNAQRQPRRTAATASALMIGLALVSTLTIVAASARTSVDQAIDRILGADLLVTNSAQRPFPASVAADVASVAGVDSVSPIAIVPAEVDGVATAVVAVDPVTIGSMMTIGFTDGGLAALGSGGVVVDTDTAAADGLAVGDRVSVALPIGSATLPVVGIYEPDGDLSGFVVGRNSIEAAGLGIGDSIVYAKTSSSSDLEAVQAAVESALAGYPTVTVQNQAQFKQQIIDNVNQLLVVMMMLLSLAILIAVLGIVNTLALSVIQRTREIGMLRALGALRRQVRSMVLLEALVIAAYGALIGLVLGVGFATALQRTLVGEGVEVLDIPWSNLVVFFVISAAVGVVAAVGPAFRAGRLNVLDAISTE
jgi:putative ABC transport system permease protein